MLLIDFEHHPFDTVGLTGYMRGLKDGGPTASGHLTPTVVCTLPSNAITPEEVLYNAWQARHVLTAGVHGILHTHARTAESVKAFVQITRYPFQTLERELIGEGLRGAGGQRPAIPMANCCWASKLRTATAWRTSMRLQPFCFFALPNGAPVIWACLYPMTMPMIRPTPRI